MGQHIEELKNELRKKQEQNFRLDEFVLHTLNNFCYRYLSTQKEPSVKASKLQKGVYAAKAVEENINQALADISDQEIQQKIREASPPALLYGLCITIQQPNLTGEVQILSFINWGHPDFPMASGKLAQKTQVIEFSDPLELRNKLPQGLEQACALFV